jgi:hypothetical protein
VAELASRNRLLCLVRNAPAGVVARELAAVARHPEGASRGRLARSLPRAVGSRLALSRIRDESRRAVWDRWAGADETWPVPDVGQVA